MSPGEGTLELQAPVPVFVVPVAEVDALLGDAHRDLEALRVRCALLCAEADALEAEVPRNHADHETHLWMTIRLQQFLDGLRCEAAADVDTLVRALTHEVRPAPCRFDVRAVVAEAPGPVTEESVAEASAPTGDSDLIGVVEIVADDAAPVPAGAVPDGEVLDRSDVADPPDLPDAHAGAEGPPPTGDDLEASFWRDEDAPRRWRPTLRVGRGMVLQVCALLLVITAVLVRIG